MPLTVGIRELRAQLSHYLRLVRKGEIVVITNRGKPVAQIVPYGPTSQERLEHLQASGLIAWSGQRPSAQAPIARARGEKSVAELLLEERI